MNVDYLKKYQKYLPDIKLYGSKNQAMAKCPFHEDTNPSLSINLNTGVFHCFGCNESGNFEQFEERFKENNQFDKKIIATYDYKDEEGNLLYQIVRYEPKEFKVRRRDGNGEWIYNLDGVKKVLYNLPQVLKSDEIIIVEGEKDADNLIKLGFVATTNPFGAGKWENSYSDYLKDKKVVIIPDNDEAGKRHAQKIAESLYNKAKCVKIIEFPDLKEKEDVSDWLKSKDSDTAKTLLENLIETTPKWEKEQLIDKLLKWNDILSLNIKTEFILEGLIPKGSITLLFGRGGIGKTWLALMMGKAIASGEKLFGELNTKKTPVVYIDFENPLEVLKERIEKIGKCDNLYIWHLSNKLLPPLLDSKDWELYKELPRGSLLIFDSLRSAHLSDENDSKQIAVVMMRLKELRELGYTILLLHHTPKADESIFKGSTALLDLADNILGLEELKENEKIEFGNENVIRLGHRIKTRYSELKEIFLMFDIEKGFKVTQNPETEKLENIFEILKGFNEPPTQKDLVVKIKNELGYPTHKINFLLKKGKGEYWEVKKGGKNRLLYVPIEKS